MKREYTYNSEAPIFTYHLGWESMEIKILIHKHPGNHPVLHQNVYNDWSNVRMNVFPPMNSKWQDNPVNLFVPGQNFWDILLLCADIF